MSNHNSTHPKEPTEKPFIRTTILVAFPIVFTVISTFVASKVPQDAANPNLPLVVSLSLSFMVVLLEIVILLRTLQEEQSQANARFMKTFRIDQQFYNDSDLNQLLDEIVRAFSEVGRAE